MASPSIRSIHILVTFLSVEQPFLGDADAVRSLVGQPDERKWSANDQGVGNASLERARIHGHD